MKNVLKFLTDNGHREHCDRVRGPEHEHWVDETFHCTCGYDVALRFLVATLRADGSSTLRSVRGEWYRRRYAEGGSERMMAQYTPGPWQVAESDAEAVVDARGFQVADAAFMAVLLGWSKNKTFIERADGEAEANARLIAAAPDLLECLEEAERLIDFEQERDGVGARWRAALAKAGHPVENPVTVSPEDDVSRPQRAGPLTRRGRKQ